MSNPYQSPQATSGAGFPGGDREQLRTVAKNQKTVLYALLANIIINVAAMALPKGEGAGMANLAIGVLALAVAVFSIYAMYQLATSLGKSPVLGVVLALCMCIPCLSLIVLLVVNGQATSMLQKHGVKVSLMGADPNSI